MVLLCVNNCHKHTSQTSPLSLFFFFSILISVSDDPSSCGLPVSESFTHSFSSFSLSHTLGMSSPAGLTAFLIALVFCHMPGESSPKVLFLLYLTWSGIRLSEKSERTSQNAPVLQSFLI